MKNNNKRICISIMLIGAAFSVFATPSDIERQDQTNSVSIAEDEKVKEETMLKGAHLINLTSVDKSKVRDKFIITNDTDKPILVNVYYKTNKDEWRFAGGKKIDADDDEDFDMLEGNVAKHDIYAIRIKDDSGSDYQVNWVAEHHDMCIHIGISF